ncbi:MAG TPA: hypothetical protein VHI13_11175 [Candidatus Kapabacteria bacterium]|nr:hypothetical protein [Candidatus Kapabacteria bacterium]
MISRRSLPKALPLFIALAAAMNVAAQTSGAGVAASGSRADARGGASVNYRVAIDVRAKTFDVSADLNNLAADTLVFHFPIWGPGAYDIVNFGVYVHDITATGQGGRKLQVVRGDTSTFRIIGATQKVTLHYRVHDIESVPNSLWFGLSDIEPTFAFANTPALFAYADGFKNIPYGVTYVQPAGWDVAVGLDPAKGKGSYQAQDYDELIDAPIVMGKFQRLSFEVNGVPHIIAVFAPKKLDAVASKKLVDDTKRVVEIVSGFFGDMPYKRYVFQHFLVNPTPADAMFGALEHRNSSTYRMPWYGGDSEVMSELNAVIAHEYWHAWSPKRIHVAELGPFSYQRPPHTSSLWFAEGFTEYYARLLLVRNGMLDAGEAHAQLSRIVSASMGHRQRQAITDLSLKISQVPPEEILPLYSKGPVLGMLMDATIRLQTGNRKSLDDAMRYFNNEYGKRGITFGDDEIIPIIEQATGAKLEDFYVKYIAGTEPLPFNELLPKIGFVIDTTYRERLQLGAEVDQTEKGWSIASVEKGGSADSMGMQAGDVISEIRLKRTSLALAKIPTSVAGSLVSMPDVLGFTVLRGGRTLDVTAKIVKSKSADISVKPDPNAGGLAREIRVAMFGR